VLLDKLQSDFLAYETEQGSAHVRISGRQRLYLLWTFRNFNSLPVKSLNARQQRLVENLYLRNSGRFLPSHPGRDAVVGTVEKFRLTSLGLGTATAKGKNAPTVPSVLMERKGKVSLEQSLPLIGRVAWTRRVLLWARAMLCALVAIFAWGYIQAPTRWEAASASIAEPVEQTSRSDKAQKPNIQLAVKDGASITAPPALLEQVAGPARADIQAVPIIAKAARLLSKHESGKGRDRSPGKMSAEISADMAQTAPVRVEVPRPPAKVVYPIYPSTNIRGKVALRAILRADGTVSDVKVLSGELILAKAAARAVRRWHYVPYYRDGQAVETETNVNISFIAPDAVVISFPSTISLSR
jgi:TonB family protein